MDLSLIIPVYNEEECIEKTVREARGVLAGMPRSYEIIAVDDGSRDRTPAILRQLANEIPELRIVTIKPNSGQSAAFGAGFRVARGGTVILMDADGQNDPADIPRLLDGLATCDVCCGYRARRQDTFSKRIGSRLANRIRSRLLGDGVIDTGCSLKAFKAEVVKDLPMNLSGMHRFLPALARMRGAAIQQIPVGHRARMAGVSRYTNWGRLRQTIWDLWAVRWMQKRYRRFSIEVVR